MKCTLKLELEAERCYDYITKQEGFNMGNIYDGVFRTILNDCRKLVIRLYFDKNLLMLIPFYIFSHEKDFSEYNTNEQKLEELKAEYQIILERLDELERQEVIGAFDKRTIIDLSGDVIREIAQKYEKVQKDVGDMMRGALIETEARTILNQGIQQGISQGATETKKKMALKMLKMGKLTIEEIAEYSELSVAEVEQLAEPQTV